MIKLPKNVTYHDVKQGEESWFDIRRGRVTASVVKSIMGKFGLAKMADNLAQKIAMEAMTDFETELVETYYVDRGIELEPVARRSFEKATKLKVKESGFFALGDYAGVSPDGLCSDGGLVEIKAPKYSTHMNVLSSKTIDPQYIPQVQFQMGVTGRPHCWFISYNEEVPKKHRLFYVKIYADKDVQELMNERLEQMIDKVNYWKKILS